MRRMLVVLTSAAVLLGGAPALPVSAASSTPDPTVTGAPLLQPGQPAPVPRWVPSKGEDAPKLVTGPPTDKPADGKGTTIPVLSGDRETTPGSEATRNPNGSWTTRLYQEPMFRKGADGKRTRADSTLTPGTDPETAFAAHGAYQPVKFGRNANRLVELDLGKGKVRLGSQDLKLGQPERTASGEIRYTDVATDTDLVMSLSGAGVRFQLVLKSDKAPTSFDFDLADPAGALGTGSAQPDGGYRFASAVDDGVTMGFDAPYAYSVDKQQPDALPGVDPGSAHLSVSAVKGGYRPTGTEATRDAAAAAAGPYDTLLGRPTLDDRTTSVLTPEEAGRNNKVKRTDQPDRPVDATDHPTTFDYNAFGELTRTTDPRGKVRLSGYDAVGRQTSTSWTRGLPAFGGAAQPECQGGTTAAGEGLGPAGAVKCTSVNVYDGLDQLVSTVDAARARTDLQYDALGRQTRSVVFRDEAVRLESQTRYDANSRPVMTCPPRQFAEGSGAGCDPNAAPAARKWSMRMAYDPAGHLVASERLRETGVEFGTFTGTQHLLTTASYDVDGNQVETTEPNAHPLTLPAGPDKPERLSSLGDEGTATYRTSTEVDLLDRPVAVRRPRGPGKVFTDTTEYDPVGTVRATRRQTDASRPNQAQTVTAYRYDALNRPIDTVAGASSTNAAQAGLYDEATGSNARTRTF